MSKTYIAGHTGLVGSAIVRQCESNNLAWIGMTHSELDLLDRDAVIRFLLNEKPEQVVIAAARVGGIAANDSLPVEFLSENIRIATNIIDACHIADIPRVLFLGSSCIYPRLSPQPIREDYLLTGPLEPTNESYALAKIAGLKLIQAYRRQYGRRWISAMPTNLYGPGDNFDLNSSHVMPAMIRKFHNAKIRNEKAVTLWGTGTPRREFLHVDDLAAACLHLLEVYDDDVCINIGTGTDVSIHELATLIAEVSKFEGEIVWDRSKPDGTPRKLLDVTKITTTGWKAKIELENGVHDVYHWFETVGQHSL